MAGLLDISPVGKRIAVVGLGVESIEVFGVSARGIASLLGRFPELQSLAEGGSGISTTRLMEMGAEVVAAIIAAGCGYPGNAEAEAVADALPLEAQADILEAVIEMTLPRGIGPFVGRLEKLGVAFTMKTLPPSAPDSSPSTTLNGESNLESFRQ